MARDDSPVTGHDSPFHSRTGAKRPGRPDSTGGRRRTDKDPRATFSRKFLVVVVGLFNALYLVSEALIFGHNVCP